MNARLTASLILIAIVFGPVFTGCGVESGRGNERAQGVLSDWRHVALDGAGASFPYPIYSHWAFLYEELTGIRINYQSVGSGAGVSSIQQGTVDFGASDAPLPAGELAEHGLIQFPMIIGGVVPVINGTSSEKWR